MSKRPRLPKITIEPRDKWYVVFIEWTDASGPAHNGWRFAADLEGSEGGYRCKTMGWVIGQNRDHVSVAAHLGNIYDANPDNVQFCGVMHIPRRMIVHMRRIPMR